jgi:hypothetical protein
VGANVVLVLLLVVAARVGAGEGAGVRPPSLGVAAVAGMHFPCPEQMRAVALPLPNLISPPMGHAAHTDSGGGSVMYVSGHTQEARPFAARRHTPPNPTPGGRACVCGGWDKEGGVAWEGMQQCNNSATTVQQQCNNSVTTV